LELTNDRVIYKIDNAVYVSCNNSVGLMTTAGAPTSKITKIAPLDREGRTKHDETDRPTILNPLSHCRLQRPKTNAHRRHSQTYVYPLLFQSYLHSPLHPRPNANACSANTKSI